MVERRILQQAESGTLATLRCCWPPWRPLHYGATGDGANSSRLPFCHLFSSVHWCFRSGCSLTITLSLIHRCTLEKTRQIYSFGLLALCCHPRRGLRKRGRHGAGVRTTPIQWCRPLGIKVTTTIILILHTYHPSSLGHHTKSPPHHQHHKLLDLLQA